MSAHASRARVEQPEPSSAADSGCSSPLNHIEKSNRRRFALLNARKKAKAQRELDSAELYEPHNQFYRTDELGFGADPFIGKAMNGHEFRKRMGGE